MSAVTIQGKKFGSKDQIPFKLSGFAPYNATAEQNRFYTDTQKKHTGIHKPSAVDRVSVIVKGLGAYAASKNPFSSENRFLRARDAAQDEYKKWQTNHEHASDVEKTAKLAEYIAEVQKLRRKYGDLKGGKKRSRKYSKSSKSKSRKNRKTRSRK
jgi:hypothetical protein